MRSKGEFARPLISRGLPVESRIRRRTDRRIRRNALCRYHHSCDNTSPLQPLKKQARTGEAGDETVYFNRDVQQRCQRTNRSSSESVRGRTAAAFDEHGFPSCSKRRCRRRDDLDTPVNIGGPGQNNAFAATTRPRVSRRGVWLLRRARLLDPLPSFPNNGRCEAARKKQHCGRSPIRCYRYPDSLASLEARQRKRRQTHTDGLDPLFVRFASE